MKLYKLSRLNDPKTFCRQIDFNGTTLYLLEDEQGKTLQELSKPFYDVLLLLMNLNSLNQLLEKNNI